MSQNYRSVFVAIESENWRVAVHAVGMKRSGDVHGQADGLSEFRTRSHKHADYIVNSGRITLQVLVHSWEQFEGRYLRGLRGTIWGWAAALG